MNAGQNVASERDVSIAYAHQDAAVVDRIASKLRGAGCRVFVAHDSVRPAEEWGVTIARAFDTNLTTLFVVSHAAHRSHFFRAEVARVTSLIGKDGRKRRVLPIRLDDSPLPYGLENIHAFDLATRSVEALVLEIVDDGPCATAPVPHPPAGTPARIAEAAAEVHEMLTGHAQVRLHGAPGVGKSLVARALASSGEFPWLEVQNGDDGWVHGFEDFIRRYGERPERLRFDDLVRYAGRLIFSRGLARTLVVDNADVPPPSDILPLLSDVCTGWRIVFCGNADLGLGERSVHLTAPSSSEFADIAVQGVTRPLSDAELEIVRHVGSRCDHCPVVAELVRTICSSANRAEHLKSLADDLPDDPDVHERVTKTVSKAWDHLPDEARRAVTFVAAFGQPEVPSEWLDGAFGRLRARTMRQLEGGGALVKETGIAALPFVRIHALLAARARHDQEIDVGGELVATLEAWSNDVAALAEVKGGGLRARALSSAIRFLAARRGRERVCRESPGPVLKAWVDAAPRDAREALRHFQDLVPRPEDVRVLSPLAWAELLDKLGAMDGAWNQTLDAIDRDGGAGPHLQAMNREARTCVERWMAEFPRPPEDPALLRIWVVVAHHLAKAAGRAPSQEGRRRAADLLEAIDASCTNRLLPAAGDARYWRLRRANARMQMASEGHEGANDLARQLLACLEEDSEVLAPYFRLAMINKILRIRPRPEIVAPVVGDLIHVGLAALGDSLSTPEANASFIRTCVEEFDGGARPELLLQLTDIVSRMPPPATPHAAVNFAGASLFSQFPRTRRVRNDC